MQIRFMLLIFSIALLSGGLACGLIEDAINDITSELEQAALDAGVDPNATIADQETAEAVFAPVMNTVLGTSLEAAMLSLQEANAGATPMQDAQSIAVDNTITFENGGSLTAQGTASQSQTADDIELSVDLTVDWTDLPVSTETDTVLTSGTVVLNAVVTINPETGEPAAAEVDIVGEVTVDQTGAFGFDTHMSLSPNGTLLVSGTLNGQTYEAELQLDDDSGANTTDAVTDATGGTTETSN